MTPRDAQTRLRRLIGAGFRWRTDANAPAADERPAALERLRALRREKEAAEQARDARANIILSADDEYQRLKADAFRLYKAHREAIGPVLAHRVTVYDGIHVEAEADNWADAVRAVEAKKGKATR